MRQCKRNEFSYADLVHRRNADKRGRTLFERPPLFSGILPGEYSDIASAGRIREFSRGEILYIEGEPVRQVLLLTSGLVKITKLGLSGTEVILRLGGPGDVLAAADPFCTGAHRTTAQAFRSCRALVWEAAVFKTLVSPFPVLQQNIARILVAHLMELEERFREIATEKVGTRVARQLVRLLEQIGQPIDGAVEIGVSREELAQMTGTTLFTVSRLFSAWEGLGLVKPRREAVVICDIDSLRAIAEGFVEDSCNKQVVRPFEQRTPNPARTEQSGLH